jgi:hypothetical protein
MHRAERLSPNRYIVAGLKIAEITVACAAGIRKSLAPVSYLG